ncbi:hypothetical protein OESDEN_18074 [Oesophagostomum dentatum]|uniref:Uncharacterized protein n=1 Tax=Oesophagostomum dentatum TaxID=61180 RepID=A0A0B1SBE5_OESDE|nr:hypothetical protein OESDEN_18074 [Oesophagostomum dentatum]
MKNPLSEAPLHIELVCVLKPILFVKSNFGKWPRDVVVLSQDTADNKPPSEESTSFHTSELLDCEPPPEQAVELMDDHFHDFKPTDEPVLLPVSVLKIQVPQSSEMKIDLGPFPSPVSRTFAATNCSNPFD